ncbi:hypothetical protein FI667_g16, partial [Globisporangium splendens]
MGDSTKASDPTFAVEAPLSSGQSLWTGYRERVVNNGHKWQEERAGKTPPRMKTGNCDVFTLSFRCQRHYQRALWGSTGHPRQANGVEASHVYPARFLGKWKITNASLALTCRLVRKSIGGACVLFTHEQIEHTKAQDVGCCTSKSAAAGSRSTPDGGAKPGGSCRRRRASSKYSSRKSTCVVTSSIVGSICWYHRDPETTWTCAQNGNSSCTAMHIGATSTMLNDHRDQERAGKTTLCIKTGNCSISTATSTANVLSAAATGATDSAIYDKQMAWKLHGQRKSKCQELSNVEDHECTFSPKAAFAAYI